MRLSCSHSVCGRASDFGAGFGSFNFEGKEFEPDAHFLMILCVYPGVHPYWIGDLDSIIMKTPELYTSHPHGTGGLYGNRKSLSQQLEFPHTTTQVRDLSDIRNRH